MKLPSQRFQTTIYKIWMMRHVDVPTEVADALIAQLRGGEGKATRRAGKSASKSPKRVRPKYVPVVANVNGCSARVTLMPAGGGLYRIQLNTELRKAAHADVGDVVRVELQLDRASREEPVPAELRLALKENPAARRAFDELTTGHRRHFIKWFDSAKGPDTRIRRLGQAIEHLLKRALSRPTKHARTHRK
jgi:Bacteriocin-protection, YdeI or OmpD-Associated/Domain of unknown function (DUF1905)